ncbi:glutathione hydrolase 1 proenzyme-like isoform X1 [Biomphalaria glabrata]|uniref:Glutathione hydrolase 1 proenzyme-like isoform X1 n=2 Tax=Biomphalaria glabrata TaxID=6526 RepID=A0A9W2YY08_BIOGL|nr:glutathione hydrolase 1 proenzyme-like isoform X1 [Biomphalaria glabrata]XP_055867612.1 glutathione hydrolase 1 proenzyme-like isoform X1 [Biomphalaria glabrata]
MLSQKSNYRHRYEALGDDEEAGSAIQRPRNKGLKIALAGSLTLLISAGVTLAVVFGTRQYGSPETSGYEFAAVAADTQLCSTVGKNILLKGGNAVDAAIATLVCTGLGSPQSMGIGGGFFMTIYNGTTGQSTIIDARETAPGNANESMFFYNRSNSAIGGLSIAVPGEIKGYWYAHQKYGRLPWAALFEPSIKYAADGFPVPIGLHKALIDGESFIRSEPSLNVAFVNQQTNKLYTEGEIIKMPQLAATLKAIAEEGVNAFYNGSLTNSILEDLKAVGSIITREDLLNYTVVEKKPVEAILSDGIKVISPPAPSGGPVLSFILNILDGFYFNSGDISTPEARIATYHKIIETFKFAYAKRTGLGDDTDKPDIQALVRNLTSRDYADSIRSLINASGTYDYMYYGPTYYNTVKTSTSHVSLLDQEGSAVSVTSTVNARFGSRRRGMKTGIIFNDEMDDFSTPNITNEWGIYPSPANFIAPGRRPLSSMCPAIFVDSRSGKVSKVLGAAGGSMITSATAWVAAHILWLGESLEAAVSLPRLHHQLLPPAAQFEKGFEDVVIQGLIKLGHKVTEFPRGKSIIQGVNVRGNRIFAKSDDRKGGIPDGY